MTRKYTALEVVEGVARAHGGGSQPVTARVLCEPGATYSAAVFDKFSKMHEHVYTVVVVGCWSTVCECAWFL